LSSGREKGVDSRVFAQWRSAEANRGDSSPALGGAPFGGFLRSQVRRIAFAVDSPMRRSANRYVAFEISLFERIRDFACH